MVPDPVMVFRYSALTFNGHRILYDADYTRTVEGYPERVVNGGLTTLLLLELARAQLERPLATVATRILRPLFVDRPLTLNGASRARGVSLWVTDADGALALSATAETRIMTGGPLAGVRVLDLTAVVVGPVCTQTLADHGAEVIKIEPPEGDLLRTLGGKSPSGGMASKFLAFNRNKRSLALDMKSAEGREIMARLVARADVLVAISGRRRSSASAWGYDDCAKLNPRLIYCSLVGFGQNGRYRAKPAYDTIIQARPGSAACYERATGEPRYVPMVMADHIVGMIAVQQIAMALFHRERTGAGQAIEDPMFENMAAFVLAEHLYLKTFEPRLAAPATRG
ncbi:MAG: CoA transferase [Pseudomonadota bacterium]